jgi:acetylornithine deacetylase/succinyl-diaminopimelate desuccinylase-like protein
MHIKNHFLILLFLAPLSLFAQKVERGLSYLDKNEKQYIQWLIDIGQIISPSGQEQERAEAVAAIMREIGLQEVRVNEMPNAIGIIPGKSNKSIVFISTLDDLAGVAEHQRKAEGPPYYAGGRIIGPGTNTSSTSVSILAAAQALIESNIQPEHNLVFAAVAQEETGLKGMKHLFEEFKDEAVIFVDVLGDGHRISYGALGIHWWKVVASGPPGHTLSGGRPDMPNVNQAIGRAVDLILQLPHPILFNEQRTRINVGMISSGNVFNHKPETGFFSLDIRSLEEDIILDIEKEVRTILAEVGAQTKVQLEMEPFQIMQAGQIEGFKESALVQKAAAVSQKLGYEAGFSNSGSSNMNVAISQGVPAIGLGGKSRSGQRGFPDEWADVEAMMNTAKFVSLYAQSLN